MTEVCVQPVVAAERGFTLVELVIIMIIVGILAVAAMPRFADRTDFDARGFYDGTLSALRYAQKSAIAQRRNVCVAFSAAGVVPATITLRIRNDFSTNCNAGCGNNALARDLAGPTGLVPHRVTAPAGVTFAAAAPLVYPSNFNFCPSGAASAGQAFGVQQLPGNTITIVGATGYVY